MSAQRCKWWLQSSRHQWFSSIQKEWRQTSHSKGKWRRGREHVDPQSEEEDITENNEEKPSTSEKNASTETDIPAIKANKRKRDQRNSSTQKFNSLFKCSWRVHHEHYNQKKNLMEKENLPGES